MNEKGNYSNSEKVLLALYSEWLSDAPDFHRVNHLNLQINEEVFVWSLMKLSIIGEVSGFKWQPEGAATPDRVRVISREALMLTAKGVEHAQELAETSRKRTYEAIRIVAGIFKDIGIAAFSGLITAPL